MPVTDLSGDDWLASLMANYGATAPYDPSQHPSLTPNAGVPGGGLLGYPAMTPGAPSMGYPSMGQPPAPPGPAQGLSLTNNPIANAAQGAYGNIHNFFAGQGPYSGVFTGANPLVSVGAPNLANIDPRAVQGFNIARAKLAGMFGGSASAAPAATATAPPAKRTDAAYGPYDDPGAPAPIGDYAARVGNYGSWPTTAGRPVIGSPGPSIANAPLPPRRPSSFGGQTPGAGAPQGQPSQTPRPPKSSNRFGTVQYQVPGSGVGPLSRSPIYTTLNLFGGR